MTTRAYLTSILEELRLDLGELGDAPMGPGTRSWIGVAELLDGMIVRLYPPLGTSDAAPADVYIRAVSGGLVAQPVHEYPALATDLDLVVETSDGGTNDEEVGDDDDAEPVLNRWVVCTALARPVGATQARDAVLLAKVSPDQAKGITWFIRSLVSDDPLFQSRVVGHGEHVVLEELVRLHELEAIAVFGASPEAELSQFPRAGKRVYVQRGVAAPPSDPRHQARELVWEHCAWLDTAAESVAEHEQQHEEVQRQTSSWNLDKALFMRLQGVPHFDVGRLQANAMADELEQELFHHEDVLIEVVKLDATLWVRVSCGGTPTVRLDGLELTPDPNESGRGYFSFPYQSGFWTAESANWSWEGFLS